MFSLTYVPKSPTFVICEIGVPMTLSRFKDVAQVFACVLFWMGVLLWASAWDGRDNGEYTHIRVTSLLNAEHLICASQCKHMVCSIRSTCSKLIYNQITFRSENVHTVHIGEC